MKQDGVNLVFPKGCYKKGQQQNGTSDMICCEVSWVRKVEMAVSLAATVSDQDI